MVFSLAFGHLASIFLYPFAPPALPGFAATMGTLTPGRPVLCVLMRNNELRPEIRPGLLVSCIQPSDRSASNHLLPSSGLGLVLTRSLPHGLPTVSLRGTLASIGLRHPLEVGHDNQPNRVRYPADQSFTSSCSPPPLTRTQLLSVTEFKPTPTRTFTLLIRYTYKRTTAGPSARMISHASNKVVP